jgi:hypothetical protein
MSSNRQQPATVVLRSYAPLGPGQASVVESLDPERLERIVRDQERLPSGQAQAWFWLDFQGRPTPVFVLEHGREIAAHLSRWSEGCPSDWFKLHVAGVGPRFAIALAPDPAQVIERWRLAHLEQHGKLPAAGARFSVLSRPLFYVGQDRGAYEQVTSRLGMASFLGLLGSSHFDPSRPEAVEAGAVAFLGPFALGNDPGRPLAGLCHSLVQPPPSLPPELQA